MVKYPILIFWSDEDGEYVARVPDLEGCTATGETIKAAAQEIQIAMELWLDVARESGFPIPIPTYQPILTEAS
jgi:predicted RNase H-like HicB family nuclease